MALKLIDAGVPLMTETPIATELADADAMISAAQEKGVKLETAENYYRRPTALRCDGVAARISSAFMPRKGWVWARIWRCWKERIKRA